MHLFYGLFFNKEVLLTQTIITNKVLLLNAYATIWTAKSFDHHNARYLL